MRLTNDWLSVYRMYESMEEGRKRLESWVSTKENIPGYCSVCGEIREFYVGPSLGGWKNLRGGVSCAVCHMSARCRSFIDATTLSIPRDPSFMGLIFERITPLYKILSSKYSGLVGCEYLGSDVLPGTCIVTPSTLSRIGDVPVRHEDMMNLSFEDSSLDYILHSDVLEHVPEPITGLYECFRTLKRNGLLLFACPIYACEKTQKIAALHDGVVEFYREPLYHGDPLSEGGIAVFNNFGFDIFELVSGVGFSRVEIGFTSEYMAGYYSDANPWRHALMWHIVVRATK